MRLSARMGAMGLFDELFDADADSELAENLEAALDQMAQSAQRFAVQTCDGRSRDKLVRVWVNAQCVVVQVEIDEDLFAESTPDAVQKATVEAAQAAAAAMQAKAAAFQTETRHQIAHDFGTDPEPTAELSMLDKLRPAAPLTPPNASDRRAVAPPTRADDRDGDPGEWQLRISD